MAHCFFNAFFVVASFGMTVFSVVCAALRWPQTLDFAQSGRAVLTRVGSSAPQELGKMLAVPGERWPLLLCRCLVLLLTAVRAGIGASPGRRAPCSIHLLCCTHRLLQHCAVFFHFDSGQEVSVVLRGAWTLLSPWGRRADGTWTAACWRHVQRVCEQHRSMDLQ